MPPVPLSSTARILETFEDDDPERGLYELRLAEVREVRFLRVGWRSISSKPRHPSGHGPCCQYLQKTSYNIYYVNF